MVRLARSLRFVAVLTACVGLVALAVSRGQFALGKEKETAMKAAQTGDSAAARASAEADLRVAWDEMIANLVRAREAIDNPRLDPPPATDRNLAEGYRYLLGFIYGTIERALSEDTRFPEIRVALHPLHKATIENTDALYLKAPIDADATYLLKGKAQDHRHWRGEPAAPSGRKAPQYVWFGANSAYTGDSGSLAELNPSVSADTGTLDSSSLLVEPDGSFQIMVAPKRPDGYTGNFIATKATVPWKKPDGTVVQIEQTAHYLTGRELFYDWAREDPLDLYIVRVGEEGRQPAPMDPSQAAARMKRVGEIVNNQMRFWNEYYAVLLEAYGDRNGDGKRFMPRNDLNGPTIPTGQFGSAQSTNVYAGGIFELAEDEALIVEERIPVPPLYIGFCLGNLWGESTDYANHVSSLNGFQTEQDADGVLRYVVAHRDPGVPNWVDTTGLPEGYIGIRWVYSKRPDRLPSTKVMKVPFTEIRRHLPAGTRTVSAEERRNQIRLRQEHVNRRYHHS